MYDINHPNYKPTVTHIISAKIDDPLLKKIDDFARKYKVSRTTILKFAIIMFLEVFNND